MASKTIRLVEWLQSWFPLKGTEERTLSTVVSDLTSLINGKSDKEHGHGNITKDGKVTTGNDNATYIMVTDGSGGVGRTTKAPSTLIKEASALARIGTNANATQHDINLKINEKIGDLLDTELVEIVQTLPAASASTMNKLYLVVDSEGSGESLYKMYITIDEGNSSFSWELVDDANIKGFITETSADSKYVAKESGKALFPNTAYNIGTTTPFQFFVGQGQYVNLYTYITQNCDATARAPTYHASSSSSNANPYGVGTTSLYGHCKVVNHLDASSYIEGNVLSAFQGYKLNQDITRLGDDIESISNADGVSYTAGTDWGEAQQVISTVEDALNYIATEFSLKSETIVDIELVSKSTNADGVIKLIYG